MKSDSWFACYPSDLIADTQHLSNHDFGAYFRLLCFYYLHGPLPDDDESLKNVSRVESINWARCKGVVFQLFKMGEDGKWHSKRADLEIAERFHRDAKRKAQTEAARAALRSVTNTVTDTVTTPVTFYATAVQPQPQPQPQVQPQLQLQKDVGRNGSRPGKELDSEWIESLGKSDAYAGINVSQELSKMEIWCDIHRRKPTRRRFIAWLNRVETPMSGTQNKGKYVPNL